jgi:hypothetical protein
MRIKVFILSGAVLAGFLFHGTAAAVPLALSLEGRLADSGGNPIKAPTQVIFTVFQGGSVNLSTDGKEIYKEMDTITPGSDGTYQVSIGNGTPLDGTSIRPEDFDTALDIFLQLTINGTALLPRIKMSSVSASLVAAQADLALVAESAAPGSVTGAAIATGTITPNLIAPGSLTSAQIAPGSITANSLADGTLTSLVISPGSITGASIAPGAIGSVQLSTGAVGAANIQNGAVTLATLGPDTAGFLVPSGLIAMFAQACPGGWTRFGALDNLFPMGTPAYSGQPAGSAAITGLTTESAGAHSHTVNPHSHSAGTLVASGAGNFYNGGEGATSVWTWNQNPAFPVSGETGLSSPGTDVQGSHTHVIDSDGSWRPPYLGVVFCQKN